jgi:2-phosphosulfolactate phosphatase
LRVKVGFTPAEQVAAPLGIVIDVLRATSTICQALASGVERVICVGEIDDARALAGPGVALAGERGNVRIDGFDHGNSPREFAGQLPGSDPLERLTRHRRSRSGAQTDESAKPTRPDGRRRQAAPLTVVTTLVLTTTNGTRLLLAAAARCDEVLVASLLNLDAVVSAAGEADDVAVLCAGVEGAFAIDDAYVAGRIAAALGGEPDDAAAAAVRLAGSFETPEAGIGGGISAANIRNAQLDDDIPFCARESALDVVPRVVARSATAVEIATSSRP